MTTCTARHILVELEEVCQDLKEQIEAGADFAKVAAEFSACPSGQSAGGSLGKFGPGKMVKEFDEVCFTGELNTVLGPIETEFGFHLIEITAREE